MKKYTHEVIMANRERVLEIAKEMLGIPEDKNLSKRMVYRLVGACNKCEIVGEQLTDKQVIASIVEMVELIDNVEMRLNK